MVTKSRIIHKPLRRSFHHLKVIVRGLNNQIEVDLADMQKLKDKNDGVHFLLVVIDVFSRFMWVKTLENKLEDMVIDAFRCIFQRAKKPRRLRTDRGGEFTGRKVQDYFDSINIEHWTAHNDEMKANFAERVIQTLKKSLWGYMRTKKNYRYINVLKDIVHSYNNTKHCTTDMKSSEVTKGHVERHLWWQLYKPTESYEKLHQISRVPFAYKKGDKVHISHMVKTFEREYDKKWTREIFEVVQSFKHFGIRKYCLCDLDGEDIKGTFYKADLQLVDYLAQGSFEIEKSN